MLNVAVQDDMFRELYHSAGTLDVSDLGRSAAGQLTSKLIQEVMQSIASQVLPPSQRSLQPWGYVFPFDQPTPLSDIGYTNLSEYQQWCSVTKRISGMIRDHATGIYGEEVEVQTDISQADLQAGIINIKVRLVPPVQRITISLSNESVSMPGLSANAGIAQASPPKIDEGWVLEL